MSLPTETCVPASRPRSAYFYTYHWSPKIANFPLHLATHNGRAVKIKSLLQLPQPQSVYQLASDAEDEKPASALFIAIARKHTQIAHLYLDIICADLRTIQQHFDQLDGAILAAKSRFWLHERVLVAFGRDHIDFALRESIPDRVQSPAEMVGKTGLLILLKPDNHSVQGVLWLSTRQPGSDRRIARIVDHIYERGGELSLRRRERFDCSLLDVAARMNLAGLWQRMLACFGQIARRQFVISCRYLAEHAETVELKRAKFRALCEQSESGFPIETIFASGDEADILHDAIEQYTGDFSILEYLIELAIAGGRQDAAGIVNQIVIDRGIDRSLLNVAFQLADKDLPWKLLKYRPDLVSGCSEWWDTPAHRYISERPFDEAVHRLILAQLQTIASTDELRGELLASLVENNWEPTVRELFRDDARYRVQFEQNESGLSLLRHCVRLSHFEVLQFLVSQCEIEPDKRRYILSNIVEELRDAEVPEVFWSLVHVDKFSPEGCQTIIELLFTALRSRQLDLYGSLLELLPADVQLQDIRNAHNDSLLFAAIYDKTHRNYANTDYIESESLEVIDSEDDAASIVHKMAENLRRTPPDNIPKGVPHSNRPLELSYRQLFDDLLAAGLDVHHQNDRGANLAHIAVELDNLFVLNRLKTLRVNLSHGDQFGRRPMHFCSSVAAFRALPSADVLALDHSLDSPMLVYLQGAATLAPDEELLPLFIEAGSVAAQANCQQQTALHLCRLPTNARLLLEAGADVNAQNYVGDTPSHCAFRLSEHRMDMVRLLFAHPEHDVFRQSNEGFSLLANLVHLSEPDFGSIRELMGEEKMARLLAEHCNCPTDWDLAVLDGCLQGHLHSLQMLLDNSDFQLVDPAVQLDQLSVNDEGRFLIGCGAHIRNRADKAPIDWSACLAEGGSWLAQLRLFGEVGANLEMTNRLGETGLQWYTWRGEDKRDYTRIVARLLVAGAKYRKLTVEGVPVLRDTVFRSFYEWDEEKGETIEQQVFQSKCCSVGD